MTRVAIQLTSTGGFYGAERTLAELAAYLAQHGWESHVVALEGKGGHELVRRAADYGVSAMAFGDGGRLGAWAQLKKLQAVLGRHSQAIVHSHGYKPDILLAALRTTRRLSCIATCHTWYSDTLKMKIVERLDKRVLRGFDHVVAVSEEIRADIIASGVSSRRVSRIDNGISMPAPDPDARDSIRREFGIGAHERLVVQIGRLAKSKRNDLLLQALARLRTTSVKVLLVGDGDQREALREHARSLGITTRVTFCGYRTDAHRILTAADLLALTSNKEGLPIVLLEAMAMGCPIVATSVGAVPTVLTQYENGWVVPAENLDSLVRAIEQALTDRPLAERLADRGKADFRSRFSRDAMGRHYLDLYEDLWRARGWV